MNHKKLELDIRISSWIGLSFGARHYYVEINAHDIDYKHCCSEKTEWLTIKSALNYVRLVIEDRYKGWPIDYSGGGHVTEKEFYKAIKHKQAAGIERK
jgi:hypothetical protein